MQNRGEIIRKAVSESGISITMLAKRLNKSRRTVYNIFESTNVSLEIVIEIGKLIHHDFSGQIKELKKYENPSELSSVNDEEKKYSVEYWKSKYYELLEKHNELLESSSAKSSRAKAKGKAKKMN